MKMSLYFLCIAGAAAAAAKLLQSCPTLCGPIDGSPPGSPVPWILQARTLEWVAISFSNAWRWKVKVKTLSRIGLLATLWTAAHRAPSSMGFSRQEYWSGLPLPSPHCWGWGSANHICSLPAGESAHSGQYGESGKPEGELGITASCLLPILIFVSSSCQHILVSLTQQSTDPLFQWQQLIHFVVFPALIGPAKQSLSSEVWVSALHGASSKTLKL